MLRQALVVGVVAVVSAAQAGAAHQAPKSYYLALGDSIAYGVQPAKVDKGLPPSRYDTGYVDVFGKRLRGIVPEIQVVNYSCPGESTVTFVRGGCPGRGDVKGLHDSYRGTQLAAALAFLAAHRGRVSPITITLWGNDINPVAEACQGDFACIQKKAPAAIAAFESRLGDILGRLRKAAPAADIVATGAWNFNVEALAMTDPIFLSVDASIRRATAGAKARFANLYPVMSPRGNAARARARLCAYSSICAKDDPHPTDAGYRAIAGAVWTASGY
jgi:lysophospholipase L1-like esterase